MISEGSCDTEARSNVKFSFAITELDISENYILKCVTYLNIFNNFTVLLFLLYFFYKINNLDEYFSFKNICILSPNLLSVVYKYFTNVLIYTFIWVI